MIQEHKELVVALAGNPNSGKSSIFNHLTGSRQQVGNWPGVTIEKHEGIIKIGDTKLRFVDLPGTYGLNANSIDEVIARDFLIKEKPDVVINVVDGSNLQRNLYLTVQLIELGLPMIIALNMADEVESLGDRIDYKSMAALLHCPVIRTIGNRGQGIEELKQQTLSLDLRSVQLQEIRYGEPLDNLLTDLTKELVKTLPDTPLISIRWLAVKLLEGEDSLLDQYILGNSRQQLLDLAARQRQQLEHHTGLTPDLAVVSRRYGIVQGVIRECVEYAPRESISRTEKIDNVLLHRRFAIPLFLGVMWLTYQLTFMLGKPITKLIELGIHYVQKLGLYLLQDAPLWVQGFISNGIIGGVGTLLVYLPNIILLFLVIAFLEDSGYMARAAFVMDRFMHRVGLHGKSFIPLILGFGCNVPAILATRTLENRQDRILTIIINPFISCGARMPIWWLMCGAFFPAQWAGTIVFGIIFFGVLVAIFSAKIINSLFFGGKSAPFVMELPPYRMPTIRALFTRTWDRTWLFLKKVGTVILLGIIIIWFLGFFPSGVTPNSSESYAGKLGACLEPVLKPLGLDWRAGVALTFGLIAKEVVISSLAVLFQLPEVESTQTDTDASSDFQSRLQAVLRTHWSPLQAVSFMIFALLYMPCVATLGVIFRELHSVKWSFFAIGYGLLIAYVLAFITFQVGSLIGLA